MKAKFLSTLLASLAFGGAASAATIDTSALGSGFLGGTVAVTPEAVITSSGTDLFFGGADSRPDSFCAIQGSSCEADFMIDFVGLVENLTFVAAGADVGDFIEVFALDALGTSLGSVTLADVGGLIDLSAFGPLASVFIDDSSTGGGFGYAEFSFDLVSEVPLPVSGALLLAALAGTGLVRRRKPQQSTA
ncbi:hypothetical protein [Pseudooceanicola sp. LIPI14-2-Ac024]|uniref:hypothetical protein n=1 Tax=Pseudooceanicola sp. LIPI14-2-Ac024 TaxID=3344875 RepID=UPI0035D11538